MAKESVKFLPIVIGLLLAGVFIVSLIPFGIRLAEVNNAPQSIGDSPSLSNFRDSLNTQLQESGNSANGSLESFGDSPISITGGSVIFEAISGIWKTVISAPIAIWNLISELVFVNLFGSTFSLVFWTLAGILILIVIFAVWRLVIQGDAG